ncbi:MAG: hypothetical protein ACLUNN_07485 [Alistipes finegoldii]
MDIVNFPTTAVISTENNGFAGGERDENLIDEELLETEIPLDDRIPDAAHEDGRTTAPSTTRRATDTIRAESEKSPE